MNKQILLTLTAILVLAWNAIGQLPSYVPTDGLVGYWPFNGNADDVSGNGNHGVVNGGVSLTKDRNGIENAAYSFDGNTSFINTNTKPFNSKGLTISCWFSTTSTNSGYVGLVVARNKTNWANGLYLFDYRDYFFYTNNCTSDPRIGHRDPNVNKGEWHHYVGTFDGEQLSNYVDGVLTGQSKISQEVCVTDPFLIGDDNCCGRYFIGNLDDVGIWNRALTPEEVEQLYTGQIKQTCLPSYVPTDSLVGYWPFCGNANDVSGNGNDGVVNGATLAEDRFGKQQSAYEFDGKDDNIHINTPFFNTGWDQFTVSSWVKLKSQSNLSNGNFVNPLLNTNPHNGLEIAMNWMNSNKYSIWLGNGDPNSFNYLANAKSKANLIVETWHHVTLVKNKNQFDFYLNGTLDNTKIVSDTIKGKMYEMFFGSTNPIVATESIDGSIDDIGIWKRALTPEEIKRLYLEDKNLCLPSYVPTKGLFGYWPFCGDAEDESGNGNNGVVSGATLAVDRFGQAGNAYFFDGVDDRINCTAKFLDLGTKSYTISAWAKSNRKSNSNNFNDSQLILNSEPHQGVGIVYNGSSNPFNPKIGNKLNVLAGNGVIWNAIAFDSLRSSQDFEINKWNFITFVKEGTLYKLFINNILVDAYSSPTNLTNVPVGFIFGNITNGYPNEGFSGELDDIGIWNRALTHREIQELYTGCNLVSDINPASAILTPGQSARFTATGQDTVSHWQWQSQIAEAGWSTLADNNKYSGVKTSTLAVSNAEVNQHQQQFRVVASNALCTDTSDVAILLLSDTCLVTLTDTILTTVTDTLLIDVVLSGTNTPGSNLIRVYPNPTSSQLVIDAGQYTLMNGYTLTVTAANGAAVWAEAITQPVYTLDLSGWGGKGLFYITLTDPQGKVITTRKIVLQ